MDQVLKTMAGIVAASLTLAMVPDLAVAGEGELLQEKHYFELRPESFDKALLRWSGVAHIQFLYVPTPGRKRSPPVKGYMTAETALKVLLTNSGLTYERVTAGNPSGGLSLVIVPVSDDSEMEEVPVIGSRIPGSPIGSPYFLINMDVESAAGVTSIDQLLARLPEFTGGSTPDTGYRFSPSVSPGVSNYSWPTIADLRGLGAGTTLVLIDGQRAAPSAADDGRYVDLAAIPIDAIEQIQVLTDGASALYGSDAVGGVVDLIMRDSVPGGRTHIRMDRPTLGGGTVTSLSQSLGTQWEAGNAGLFYEYQKADTVDATDRPATESIGQVGYPWASLTPRQRNHLLFATASQSFDSGLTMHAELSWSNRNLHGGYGLSQPETESLFSRARSNVTWAVVGAEMHHEGLVFHLDGGFSDSDTHNELRIVAVSSPPGEPVPSDARYKTQFVSTYANATPLHLPTGDVEAVIGAAFRHESISRTGLPVPSMSTNISALFGELRVPLLLPASTNHRSLILSIADRYERYSYFEGANSPHLGLAWRVWDGLQLRSSYGRSYRAPLPTQLDGAGSSQRLEDVADSSVPAGTLRALGLFGPNPQLRPQRAHTFTAGFDMVFHSLSDLTLTATYYDIVYRGQISPINDSFDSVLRNPAYAGSVLRRSDSSAAAFNERVAGFLTNSGVRTVDCKSPGSTPGTCLDNPANVDAIVDFREQPMAETLTDGIDMLLSGVHRVGPGALRYNLNLVRVLDFKTRATQTSEIIQRVNTAYNPLSLRLRAGVGYSYKDWGGDVFLNRAGAYVNDTVQPTARVSAMTTVDLSLAYRHALSASERSTQQFSVVLRGQNIFDRPPPFVAGYDGSVPYDPKNEDPFGRELSLGFIYAW